MAREIRAPADSARRLTYAYTGMPASAMASPMRSAASTRPPGVSISSTSAAAPSSSASRMARSMDGARPSSITPVTGTTTTGARPTGLLRDLADGESQTRPGGDEDASGHDTH